MANLKGAYKRLYRPIIIAALAFSGSLNMISVVLADGTAAGTVISNTATATYTDPEDQIQTTTSNTVTVTVAEVAGITVTPTGAAEAPAPDSDADTILEAGEQVQFTYDITNVGNDLTDISLPAAANPTGPVSSVDVFEYSTDGGTTYQAFTARTVVENIEPGEVVKVRVTATVSNNAQSGDTITVTYGDTPGNAQNQPYDNSGGSVFTADTNNDDTITDTNDPEFGEASTLEAPRNGEREAAAVADITVDELPLQQPLVQLNKTGGTATDATPATPIDPTDDTLTYNLDFSVLNTDPTGSGVTPATLQPITLNVTGGTADQYVLVSDAVPEGTTVDLNTLPTATASGWQVVYTSDPITTSALEATWTTAAPTTTLEAQAVTRIGFINSAAIALNANVTGFSITVVTDRVNPNANPITIANIAQVFGSGAIDDPITPEDESLKFPVMDESGDQTPSNYNPTDETFSNFDPDDLDSSGPDEVHDGFTPSDGFINDPSDLANTGTDTNQDNTGTGDDGEALVTVLVPETPSDLLNGPDGAPDAIGPTSTNDDFTNKSTPFAEGENPAVVPFSNTLDNDSATSGWVKLEPTPPTEYLPAGTTATIIANDINGNPVSATYTYNGTTWSTTDPEIYVPIGANDETDPLDPANGGPDQLTYGVEVDLPQDDDGVSDVAPLTGYPVPIEASFVPVGSLANGSAPTQAEMSTAGGLITATNTTIDRVYTGFLELVKSVQVLQGDGPAVSGDPAPGNILRYQIRYENISEQETNTMSNNVTLFAQNLDIVEDGTERACNYATLVNANNWALDNDDDNSDSNPEVGTLDTSHVLGSVNLAAAEAGSVVVFYSGGAECNGNVPNFNPTAAVSSAEQSGISVNTDVTKYLFDIGGDIQPGESGFVEFDRLVN